MDSELIHSGLISYMDENYKTAVDQFSKALEKNHDNSEALFYRGASFIKIGNYSSALTDLDKADKLKENDYEIIYKKALAYFMSMDFSSGHKELDRLRKLSENINDEQKDKVEDLTRRFS
jgi:Flp pilus assembly protein TadD